MKCEFMHRSCIRKVPEIISVLPLGVLERRQCNDANNPQAKRWEESRRRTRRADCAAENTFLEVSGLGSFRLL